jgi:hypothetical protein
VLDQLRLFLNRPLRDGDRLRLFAIAVAVIATVAGLLAVLDDAGPAPRDQAARSSARPAPASTPVGIAPVSTVEAPSEEGHPTAGVHASARDVAASKRAARRFLKAYLPYTYGRARAARIAAVTPELRAELAAVAPRVPARERRRRPRLELLQSNGVSRDRAELVALVDDGRRRYPLHLQLANTRSGWLVTGLGS